MKQVISDEAKIAADYMRLMVNELDEIIKNQGKDYELVTDKFRDFNFNKFAIAVKLVLDAKSGGSEKTAALLKSMQGRIPNTIENYIKASKSKDGKLSSHLLWPCFS
jgi:acyl-CoA hydrolase